MSYLTSFITSFCASCVFIGALYMLSPDGSMEKSVKYILNLVFILSVVSAAAFINKGEVAEMPDFTPYQTETEVLDQATARFVFETALKTAGIEFSKITVITNKTENGSISISKVIICSSSQKEKILAALGGITKNTEVRYDRDII